MAKAKKHLREDNLVNDTAIRQLSKRNSEPTHLDVASYETLGGPEVGGDEANTVKINSTAGVQDGDKTIPKSVGPEPSHRGELKEDEKEEAGDVDFGDEDGLKSADDIDEALDSFDDVDVDLDDEDEDEDEDEDRKDVKEEKELGGEEEDSETKKDDEDETKDIKEDVEDIEKNDKKVEDEDDDDKVKSGREKLGEEDEKADIDDRKGEDDEEREKENGELQESVKVRVKLPKLKLNESAIPAKSAKRITAVFEEALRRTTKQVNSQLGAHYRKLYEARNAKRDAVMAKKMDDYLSYVVEEWVKQNRVAVRQSLRVQLAEDFLTGLQRLFKEHYIDVPESKVDVVKKLTEQNEKLRKNLNEQHSRTMELKKLAEAANKGRIVAEFTREMPLSTATKMQKLSESVAYKGAKDFRTQLKSLHEHYFTEGASDKKTDVTKPADGSTVLVEDKKTENKANENVPVDEAVKEFVDVLSRQAKSDKW